MAIAPDLIPQSTLKATPEMVGEQRIILHNVRWECFEILLAELAESRSSRLAYDAGMLEIRSPLMPREHTTWLLERFVAILCEELDLNIKGVGALTSKRQGLQKGLEPDAAFYIQNEPLVRQNENIDFDIDPPPDLMIEVDFSNSSLPKEPIYLALQVPEVWRYHQGQLTIKGLVDGKYVEKAESLAFPGLPLTQQLPALIEQSLVVGEAQVVRSLRQWVRSLVNPT